jgi:hypothetical protein
MLSQFGQRFQKKFERRIPWCHRITMRIKQNNPSFVLIFILVLTGEVEESDQPRNQVPLPYFASGLLLQALSYKVALTCCSPGLGQALPGFEYLACTIEIWFLSIIVPYFSGKISATSSKGRLSHILESDPETNKPQCRTTLLVHCSAWGNKFTSSNF